MTNAYVSDLFHSQDLVRRDCLQSLIRESKKEAYRPNVLVYQHISDPVDDLRSSALH